ncbi:AraC-like DNA-binding protein [Pedobacter sp. AK017]|uniref:helix-turn-helix transcriptional regulator n=1 Tax=Pedobacter sp. AK017 TaxID=2723073 RepID=UPI00160D83CC|nr:helix-turn-helix transcriptional regulator [Pedobacter sp. AK017]MBB5440103.1 AraC-like DNA-binding protein [Pedobacter sp. AK017]
MQSQIELHLAALTSEQVKWDALAGYSSLPLQTGIAQKIMLAEGQLLVQSVSLYLAHIELFEYCFTEKTYIDFSVFEPAFFMHADLNRNCCYLCYRPPGRYRKTVPAGSNQVMLITFRADWLIYKSSKLKELKPLTASFFDARCRELSLAPLGIAHSLFKSLKKMDATINDPNTDGDHIFTAQCIHSYYNKLRNGDTSMQHHSAKITDITVFIKENFRSEAAENLPALALRFMVSERNLARLAKMAFGIPLHEQVIKLRMEYAQELLLTTDKPVKEVALLSGYKEPYYFSKAFKKYYGKCPKAVVALQ